MRLAFVLLISLISGLRVTAGMLQQIDKAAYFHAIASDSKTQVNNELAALQNMSSNDKMAYEGALLMKKAGMETLPKNKLHYFKAGRIKLETAIRTEPENAEYRFLRLIIEEHTPKIVKYKADIETDAQVVKRGYKNFSPSVQQAVKDYSKTSKALHPLEF